MYVLQLFSSRIKRILLGTFCAFFAIVLYLFHLQIAESSRFSKLSSRNFLRQEKITSLRGNITDQHGALIATNRPIYSLYWRGTGNRVLTAEQQEILSCLTKVELLPLQEPSLDATTSILEAEKRSRKVRLAYDIPFEQLTKLAEQVPFGKNLYLSKTSERSYPYNDLACHLVGYLGSAQGKMGLEHLYNEQLQGQPGTILTVTNSVGRPLNVHVVSQAAAGATIQTTLDLPLQQIAEKLFPQDFDGCMLLMDSDGGLEVALSRPSFEPQLFIKPLSYTQWDLLQKNNAFINRAFSACYPPASLFKLVTLAAALELNLATPESSWECTGSTLFKGRHYHCNNETGHGIVSTRRAFAYSCNIPFYDIGKRISIDKLAHYAQICGLGSKTGILFPEKQGLVPTTSWKIRVHKERWWPGETLSAVIGQSSLLVTPLQMACMMNGVCTGYKVRPRILIDEQVVREPLPLQPTTLHFLKECLHSVIRTGTGSSLRALDGFKVWGKSGTAQVRSTSDSTLKTHLPHGYFVAHFQYRDNKPHTLVIFLEHASSSRYAIRLALEFLIEYAHIIRKESLGIPKEAAKVLEAL